MSHHRLPLSLPPYLVYHVVDRAKGVQHRQREVLQLLRRLAVGYVGPSAEWL